MKNNFRLLMISAMYENGGNTTHRFLDGHPQMFVYPFESQIGTKLVVDNLTSMFPVKYRWPVFPLNGTPETDYNLIIDEECKVRTRTPRVSKFRHMPFDLSDDKRKSIYVELINKSIRSDGNNVAAFYQSTFEAWKDYKRTNKELIYVGYSPVIIVDGEKILQNLPKAHVLHVVRNPWSAYADTKKRPVPLSLFNYILAWNLNQFFALHLQKKYPGRVHIVRIEDVMKNSEKTLGELCTTLGLDVSGSLKEASWNGVRLDEVYPWGTLRKVTPEVNLKTAQELSSSEIESIKSLTWQYLDRFHYSNFV